MIENTPTTKFKNKQNLSKVAAIASIGVLIMHGLTGWGILNIKYAQQKIEQPKQDKLIEITLLNAPVIEQLKEPINKNKPEPIETKPTVTKPTVTKPIETKPIEKKPEPTKPTVTKPTVSKPAQNTPTPVTKPVENKKPTTKPVTESKPTVTKPIVSAPKAPTKPVEPKPLPKPPPPTTNVSLSASNASWQRKPKFDITTRDARGAKSGEVITVKFKLIVDKKGNITDASMTTPSKYPNINRLLLRQVKRGRFNPFKNKDGLPVSGKLILPISIKVP